jgi:hypothetical protein
MTPGPLGCPSVIVLRFSEGRRDGQMGLVRSAFWMETMR